MQQRKLLYLASFAALNQCALSICFFKNQILTNYVIQNTNTTKFYYEGPSAVVFLFFGLMDSKGQTPCVCLNNENSQKRVQVRLFI